MNDENKPGNYNGWTNYETWAVKLWLDNEEPSYRYWTGRARELHGSYAAADELADELGDEVTEAAPDLGPSLYSDLLGAALSKVRWYEIAESYLEEVEPDEEECRGTGENNA
jgi:hypothetical protein